jgi:two-component system KDP operon response regulator KdpE
MKILVVDDDPQVLEALTITFQLRWQDATVIPAADGEAGLRAFYEHIPDVVVLDLVMPGKSGLEVLREIRRVSDVPVIVLTARGEEMDQVRALEQGADDYLVKPVSHLVLLAHIQAVLRRAALPPPARPAGRDHRRAGDQLRHPAGDAARRAGAADAGRVQALLPPGAQRRPGAAA